MKLYTLALPILESSCCDAKLRKYESLLKFSTLDFPYFHFATLSAISCQNIRLKEKMHILYILLQRKMNRNSFHFTHTLLALLFCNFPQTIQCLGEKEENLWHNEERELELGCKQLQKYDTSILEALL